MREHVGDVGGGADAASWLMRRALVRCVAGSDGAFVGPYTAELRGPGYLDAGAVVSAVAASLGTLRRMMEELRMSPPAALLEGVGKRCAVLRVRVLRIGTAAKGAVCASWWVAAVGESGAWVEGMQDGAVEVPEAWLVPADPVPLAQLGAEAAAWAAAQGAGPVAREVVRKAGA